MTQIPSILSKSSTSSHRPLQTTQNSFVNISVYQFNHHIPAVKACTFSLLLLYPYSSSVFPNSNSPLISTNLLLSQTQIPNAKHQMETQVIELSDTNKALRNLASKIHESNLTSNWHQHEEVMKELEHTKHELQKLKLDMARVAKEKREANRAFKTSNSKRLTLLASVELMNREIQEIRLKTVTDDQLEGAKQKLESVKGEEFKFMTSMDAIRDELNRVRDETDQLLKTKEVMDLTIQTLNSKILREKSKLESLTSLESKTNTVASNLAVTLEQLRSETKTLKKEEHLIIEESEDTIREICKTELEIEVIDEQLEAAMEELKAIKSSESKALGSLRNIINRTMEARDMASMNNSMITITDFEYGYLTGKAGGAVEIADKKIDAAHAWVEALKANEREILMKIEMVKREIGKLSLEPGPEAHAEGTGLGERVVAPARRSMYKVGSKAGVKRVTLQKFRSSAAQYSGRMGSLKRDKVMPKLV